MSIATRLLPGLALLLPAVTAVQAAGGAQTAPMTESGDHAYTNPGKVLPCEFASGTLTVTGVVHSLGCDPNHDTECGLRLEVVSIKEDTVRAWLARDPATDCSIQMVDGRKRVIGPLWRKCEEGDKLVRVSGVVTDGVLHVSRFRILGETDGL